MNGQTDSVKLFEDFTKIFVDNIVSECEDLKVSNDVEYPVQNKIQTHSFIVSATVNHLDTDLKPDTDESYTLNITSEGKCASKSY